AALVLEGSVVALEGEVPEAQAFVDDVGVSGMMECWSGGMLIRRRKFGEQLAGRADWMQGAVRFQGDGGFKGDEGGMEVFHDCLTGCVEKVVGGGNKNEWPAQVGGGFCN